MELVIGKKYFIECFKHNGKKHRSWDEAVLLEITDDILIFGNNKSRVVDSDGTVWHTREAAILYFYKNNWFNVIGQLKQKGLFYYCNIASPFVIEGDVIKYIDYDLDLRVFPNGSYKKLDQKEYNYHKKIMNYPASIDKILKYEMDKLIDMNVKKEGPFDKKTIEYYYSKYCEYCI